MLIIWAKHACIAQADIYSHAKETNDTDTQTHSRCDLQNALTREKKNSKRVRHFRA